MKPRFLAISCFADKASQTFQVGHFHAESLSFGKYFTILMPDFIHAMFDIFLEELLDGRRSILHLHQWSQQKNWRISSLCRRDVI
jgi:hypothetical protein